ncbi:MAG: hypothetical protein ABIP93_16915 [Gemmatimonadaceae bacterium]
MSVRSTTTAWLAALVLAAGCGRSEAPRGDGPAGATTKTRGAARVEAPRNPGGSGSATVTYKPGVHVIEQADGYDALVSVSTDGSTLVFDRTLGKIPALEDGGVFVIKGLLARKIVASMTSGNEVAVLTTPAALLDIVTDAKIHVESPIRFGQARSASAAPLGDGPWQAVANALVPPLYAQSPTEDRRRAAESNGVKDAYGNVASAPFKAVFSGWETTYSATPAPGRLNIKMQLKKSIANATAVIEGDGYLADFDFSSDIEVQRSTVERVQLAYKKLNGTMNFAWAVQTTAKGALRGNAKMKLPAAIEIPLYQYLGGLPLFLEVSSAVIIKPAFGAEYEFSSGKFHITYDGYQNFSAKSGTVDADGMMTGDIKLDGSEAGSGAAVGLVVAVAAPRIELSIGVSKILKFDGFKEAAEKADKYLDMLVGKAFGAEALAKLKNNPMSKVTAGAIVDATLGSSAAAFIELTTSSGQSHSGSAAMVPCTRTDLHVTASVGANASAFGVAVGNADKEIFRKDITRVKPSEAMLCKSI